jgi:hypothetical protein
MIANVAEADEHVRTAKKYIYEQERLIERLADEGQNTDDAFGLLNLLNRSLRLFERYRVFLDRGKFARKVKRDESPSACRAERSKLRGRRRRDQTDRQICL